ncbi:hypothetical protein AMAG_08719 [Allomyces macrogynus ATCC 38327]|uniref:AMP-dependent synthetase/ligase domain-containing protein n=1 Tax=Allomyces macrogynus (strain ATCC 38327) TaxID=578462 RepID=A0A0L0SM66_ALLM3|nr:hypothetical protein AMAG_08719 [Allomyces macrogynus ATCC 38327]|eukprot:KNE63617.1 hypothetical protein AMAG_08719 [Allomyces macrogynus ATCC 38327]
MVQLDNTVANLEHALIRSPAPADSVKPLPVATVGRLLFARLRSHKPDSLYMAHALDADHRRLTYGELFNSALGLAHGLIKNLGLKRGDRLAIISPNHELFFILDIACLFSGIVLVPMVPYLTVDLGAHLIAETTPHAVIVHSSLYELVREALELANLTSRPPIVMLDKPSKGIKCMTDLIIPGKAMMPSTEAQVGLDDTAFITFTSGTTESSRKAVQVTHRMILSTMVQMHTRQQGTAARPADSTKKATVDAQVRHDGTSSFAHLTGTLIYLSAALRGCSVYFLENFDVVDWLKTVELHKVTHAVIYPKYLVQIIKDPRIKDYDLSSLENVMAVSAPLSAATHRQAMEILKIPVVQGYGSSEALAVAMLHWGKGKVLQPGTIGWLKPGMEALLLDPATHEPLPTNHGGVTGPGEFLIRGPSVMSDTTGYFGRPEQTRAAFMTIGGKSWYKTGDMVEMGVDGCMKVLDRVKDVCYVDSKLVAPTEIEDEILTLHDVLDVVVVPVPANGYKSTRDKQALCALVAPQSTAVIKDAAAQATLAKIIVDHVAKAFEPHKHLARGVFFMEAIPRNQTVKHARRVARATAFELLGLSFDEI